MIELKFEQELELKAVDEWANEPKGVIECYEHSLEAEEDLLLRMDEDKESRKRQNIVGNVVASTIHQYVQ